MSIAKEKSKVVVYDTCTQSMTDIIKSIFEEFPTEVKGKKVVIKPNMLGPFEAERGVTTNPVVVEALVDYLLQEGADVCVGDNPGGQGGGVIAAAKRCGIYQASKGHFENIGSACRMVKIDSRFAKEVNISDAILDADVLIDLPRFKTHAYAGISGAIKNMFGIVVGPGKAKLHFAAPRRDDFHELLVDLYQIRVPDLIIMDGIYAMEGMGPTGGPLKKINKVLASFDGVALDATMARMMGFDCNQIHHLEVAAERNLGVYKEEDIEIIGEATKIEGFELPVSYAMSEETAGDTTPKTSTTPRMGGLLELYKLGSTIPNFCKPQSCVKCGECMKSCPVQAISLDPYPVIDRKKCISCFCCAELCLRDCFEYVDGVQVFETLFSKL